MFHVKNGCELAVSCIISDKDFWSLPEERQCQDCLCELNDRCMSPENAKRAALSDVLFHLVIPTERRIIRFCEPAFAERNPGLFSRLKLQNRCPQCQMVFENLARQFASK